MTITKQTTNRRVSLTEHPKTNSTETRRKPRPETIPTTTNQQPRIRNRETISVKLKTAPEPRTPNKPIRQPEKLPIRNNTLEPFNTTHQTTRIHSVTTLATNNCKRLRLHTIRTIIQNKTHTALRPSIQSNLKS